jgi:hypothetical protein
MRKMSSQMIIFILLMITLPCNVCAETAISKSKETIQQADKTAHRVERETYEEKKEPPSRSVEIAPIPLIFYTPETSFALGGGVVMTFRDSDEMETHRPDNLQIMAVYTLKNQAFINLAPNIYFNDTRGELNVLASYAKWPTSFFGIDNDADISNQDIMDMEETYMDESFMIQPWITHKVFSDFSAGVTFDLKQNSISDNGIPVPHQKPLVGGRISGSRRCVS